MCFPEPQFSVQYQVHCVQTEMEFFLESCHALDTSLYTLMSLVLTGICAICRHFSDMV